MKLMFLGTGGYHPNERRHTACLLFPEIGLAFDAGSGLFRLPSRLQSPDVQIFVTHSHLDHVVGVSYLLVPLVRKTIRSATVTSAPEYIRAIQTNLLSEPLFPVDVGCTFSHLTQSMPVPGAGVLNFCRLKHPGGSIGYRVDWPGRSFAYITDTTVDGSYTQFIRGVDLLVHECYFADADANWAAPTGHSHTSQVATLAKEAGVSRLLLTHIDPRAEGDDPVGLAAARKIFPNTEIAEDLMELDF